MPISLAFLAAAFAAAAPVSTMGDAREGGRVTSVPSAFEPVPRPDSVSLVPMPGWPQHVGASASYVPVGMALADVNHDSMLEVIVASVDSTVYVWDYEGTAIPGWPQQLPTMLMSKVAVGDINRDGTIEILVAGIDGSVYALDAGGTPVPGWPQDGKLRTALISPTLYDLDSDDSLEVIIVEYDTNHTGHVCVWRHDGSGVPGWPQALDDFGVGTASAGDVDGDGAVEICAPSYSSLYLWDVSGASEPGWPKYLGQGASYSQPLLYDLDDDGRLEIGFSSCPGGSGRVFVFRYDGSTFPGWPKTMTAAQPYVCPVAGGVIDDSVYSIFCGGHQYGGVAFYGWRQDGSAMPGWPVAPDMLECSPVVLDLEGNWHRCVMIASNAAQPRLYAYHADGTPVDGFPVETPDAAMPNSPAAGDVDHDGILEIGLLTKDGTVSLWKVEGVPYHPYMIDWGTWFHDNWNTGQMHPEPPSGLVAKRGDPGVHLAWNKARWRHTAGYSVYRSTAPDSGFRKLAAPTDTLYDDTTARGDTTFYYAVTVSMEYGVESRLSARVPLNPSGVDDGLRPPTVSNKPEATFLSAASGMERLASGIVFDAMGRRVLNPRSGIYFVREAQAQAVRKVVVQR